MFFRKNGNPIPKTGNLFSDFKEMLLTKYIYTSADALAPLGVSANSQFLRPTVNGLMAFSAALFEMEHLPSRR